MINLAAFKEYATGTLVALDLIGTFVFALSGATAGIRQRLDLFGVLVLSFAAKACHDLLYISGDFRRLYPVGTA